MRRVQVGVRRPSAADLVLDRKERLARAQFDDVRLATEAETLRPEWKPAQHADAGPVLGLAAVDTLMRETSADGVDVLLEGLFDVDEGTLPRAVGEVLDRRDRYVEQLLLVPWRGSSLHVGSPAAQLTSVVSVTPGNPPSMGPSGGCSTA